MLKNILSVSVYAVLEITGGKSRPALLLTILPGAILSLNTKIRDSVLLVSLLLPALLYY